MEHYVEKYRKKILEAFQFFWKNPETGYREVKTASYLAKAFEELGYSLTYAGNIPGFYTNIDTGVSGPTIAVMGELDALLCPTHPDADPQTGAVHCCGHGAQLAALLGVAAALKEPGALDGLCGKIRLMAVPAEELIEMDYRKSLKEQGIIRYFGGKVEMMYRGWFDDVDISFMIHTDTRQEQHCGYIVGGGNGCIVKKMEFQGVASHAGGSPHLGVNALYAANLTMNAANALRETFEDSKHIRFHPIITSGGDSVNAIPDKVVMEAYVRGADVESIVKINRNINRAAAASACAMGANVRLVDILGYHPIRYNKDMISIMQEAMGSVLDHVICEPDTIRGGCSDVGDLSAVMPVLHPYISGASGKSHGNDYYVTDPDTACVDSAKVQLCFLKLLLKNGAERAKQVLANYTPIYPSISSYFQYADSLDIDVQAVSYQENGSITIQF